MHKDDDKLAIKLAMLRDLKDAPLGAYAKETLNLLEKSLNGDSQAMIDFSVRIGLYKDDDTVDQDDDEGNLDD